MRTRISAGDLGSFVMKSVMITGRRLIGIDRARYPTRLVGFGWMLMLVLAPASSFAQRSPTARAAGNEPARVELNTPNTPLPFTPGNAAVATQRPSSQGEVGTAAPTAESPASPLLPACMPGPDTDGDGISDDYESWLLSYFGPIFLANDSGAETGDAPLPIRWWVERCDLEGDESASSPPPPIHASNIESMIQGLPSQWWTAGAYRYGMSFRECGAIPACETPARCGLIPPVPRRTRGGLDPCEQRTWARAQQAQDCVYARASPVWSRYSIGFDPASRAAFDRIFPPPAAGSVYLGDLFRDRVVKLQYFMFFGFNDADVPFDTGDHEGDWVCVDFDVSIADCAHPVLMWAIYHNHGRQFFVSPSELTFGGGSAGVHPYVYLEGGSNEAVPGPVNTFENNNDIVDQVMRDHHGNGPRLAVTSPINIGERALVSTTVPLSPSPSPEARFLQRYRGAWGTEGDDPPRSPMYQPKLWDREFTLRTDTWSFFHNYDTPYLTLTVPPLNCGCTGIGTVQFVFDIGNGGRPADSDTYVSLAAKLPQGIPPQWVQMPSVVVIPVGRRSVDVPITVSSRMPSQSGFLVAAYARGLYASTYLATTPIDCRTVTASDSYKSTSIQLAWDRVECASRYEIYRAPINDPSTEALIAELPATVNQYTDSAIQLGRTYRYKVYARMPDGWLSSPAIDTGIAGAPLGELSIENDAEPGGTTVLAQISFASPLLAPITLQLSSSDQGLASVPSQLFVPAGERGASFPIELHSASEPTSVSIVARFVAQEVSDAVIVMPVPSFELLPAESVAVDGDPFDLDTADIDADGDLDLVVACGPLADDQGKLIIFANDGFGRFAPVRSWPFSTPVGGIRLGDFNGDGIVDIVATTGRSIYTGTPNTLICMLGDGAGEFAAPVYSTPFPTPCCNFLSGLAHADLNGISGDELVFADIRNVRVCVCDPSGRFSSTLLPTPDQGHGTGNNTRSVLCQDLDDDGDTDILVASGGVSAILNHGDGTFATPIQPDIPQLGAAWAVVRADLDADHHPDVVVLEQPITPPIVKFHSARSNNLDLPFRRASCGTGFVNTLIGADVDGDGDTELVCTDAVSEPLGYPPPTTPGHLLVYGVYGLNAYSRGASADIGSGPMGVVAGDVDGDGDTDFVTANLQSRSLSIVRNRRSTPTPFTLLTPKPERVLSQEEIEFSWTRSAAAEAYRIDLSEDADFLYPIWSRTLPFFQTTAAGDSSIPSLHCGHAYYWRVVASGAHETQTAGPWSFRVNVPGDVTGDLQVTYADVALVESNLGVDSPFDAGALAFPGDANEDGRVDSNDLQLVLAHLGTCCLEPLACTPTCVPAFSRQPISRAARVGEVVSYAVSVVADEPVQYRWRRDGAALSDGPDISGSASPTLTLVVQISDDGAAIDVVVQAPCGSNTSTVARLSVLPPACPGDADGDRMVGLSDVALMIMHWSLTEPPVPPGTLGDLTGDGQVTLEDLAIVINHWGQSCP